MDPTTKPSSDDTLLQKHAVADATVFGKNIQAIIDTGSGYNIIDRSLIPEENWADITIQKTTEIEIKGFSGRQKCNQLARLKVRLDNKIDVSITALVIDNLNMGLIIGLGQQINLDAVLYPKKELMTIG
ncbi:MAG: hypothetical protein Q9226_003079, partial [Calogaya cf. arnoldii]